ncbi:MAG: hypothetical protein V2A70_08045 [Candidatus Omnitrophota bacterium]
MPMVRLLLAFVFLFFLMRSSFAAEIININYKYKIAFTDMTENDVRVGDSVLVSLSDGKTVRLKVLETFPVMVKLTLAEGAGAATNEQFSSIVVGSTVRVLDQGQRTTRASVRKTGVADHTPALKSDLPPGIESYSPGMAVKAELPVRSRDVVADVAAGAGRARLLAKDAAEDVSSGQTRMALLEHRLDQMMSNNIKLADNVTQLLAEKNAAEDLARGKEADTLAARKKANELSDANVLLTSRVEALVQSVDILKQEKVAQQKEIEALNMRLGELKKKLAKMVDIVNTNMKAYEK